LLRRIQAPLAVICIDWKGADMNNSMKTGAALAGTVAGDYAACTLVFWLWPEAAVNFMNGLFHGLDFRKLQSGPALFTRRLEPMTIADQPSFGGFFSLGMPGIYRLRFEVRRPGIAQPASAEFEYRVSPEGRR
jgi:hypothetical protein